jgi:hypothetical protein
MLQTGYMAATQRMAERQQGFFCVLSDAQTYRNLLFLLVVAPLGLLHGALIVLGVGVLLGIAAISVQLPFPASVVGLALIVPAFASGMVIIWWLLKTQSRINHRLLNVALPRSPLNDFRPDNAFSWCRNRMTDRWTWSGILYLLVITLIGAVSAGAILMFAGICIALIAGSVSGELGSVQITLGEFDVSVPGLRLLFLPLAPLVAIVGLHLANVLAGFAAHVGEMLLGPRSEPTSPSTSLSPTSQTAYAPAGHRSTATGSRR